MVKMMSAATKIQTIRPSHCCEDKKKVEQLRELVEELTKERQKYKVENDELKTMVERLNEKRQRKN
jgi:hypothetical protein